MQSKKILNRRTLNHASIYRVLFIFHFSLFTLFLSSCKNDVKLPEQDAKGLGLPDGFAEFYNKFHKDSLFQVAHIDFPLEGYPSGLQKDSTQNAESFRWTADKWQMQSLQFFNDVDFTRTFESPMPIVVNEIIIQKQNGYGTLRRFLNRDDGWHLIFYSDMNRLENRAPPQKPELKIE